MNIHIRLISEFVQAYIQHDTLMNRLISDTYFVDLTLKLRTCLETRQGWLRQHRNKENDTAHRDSRPLTAPSPAPPQVEIMCDSENSGNSCSSQPNRPI
eukprot:g59148.t1